MKLSKSYYPFVMNRSCCYLKCWVTRSLFGKSYISTPVFNEDTKVWERNILLHKYPLSNKKLLICKRHKPYSYYHFLRKKERFIKNKLWKMFSNFYLKSSLIFASKSQNIIIKSNAISAFI